MAGTAPCMYCVSIGVTSLSAIVIHVFGSSFPENVIKGFPFLPLNEAATHCSLESSRKIAPPALFSVMRRQIRYLQKVATNVRHTGCWGHSS